MSILVIPFQFAFRHELTLMGSVIVYGLDLFFLIDIFFNIRTSIRKATEFCETFILHKEEFLRIKKEYPEFKEVLKKKPSEQTEKTSKLLLK